MDDWKISFCPVCRNVIIVHPGKPPSLEPKHFMNRCCNKALTGEPNPYKKSPLALPRSKQKYCGAPLTDLSGNVTSPAYSLLEFIALTGVKYSVRAIIEKTYQDKDMRRIATRGF